MIHPFSPTRDSLVTTALRHGLFAGAALLVPAASHAVTWGGPGGGTDWNTPSNWVGNILPNGSFARIDIDSPIATITADLVGVPTFINIAQVAGSNGRLDHRAGTGTIAVGNDFLIARAGGTGSYNLANTQGSGGVLTGFATGSGSFNAPRHFFVGGINTGSAAASTGTANINTTGTLAIGGQLLIGNSGGTGTVRMDRGTVTVGDLIEVGNGPSATGTLEISGGTLQKNGIGAVTVGGGLAANGGSGTLRVTGGSLTAGGALRIGHNPLAAGALNSTGTFNLAGGSVTTTGELWVGNNTGATGTFAFSSGQLATNSWVLIGRKDNANVGAGGSGTVTMTGGTWTKTGESNFVIGDTGTGAMTMTGGTLTVAPHATADRGITWVGNRLAAVGSLTIDGSADFSSPQIVAAVETGTTGSLVLNGGTVRTSSITGGFGDSSVVFNGTQVVATGDSEAFIDFLLSAEIQAGGLKVDTAGYNLLALQPLEGDGVITKSGAGTLVLDGNGLHAGDSVVQGGTLMLSVSNADGGSVNVSNGAALGVLQASNFGSLSKEDVQFGTTGPSSLQFDLGKVFGNPSAAPLDITGSLVLNGPVTVDVTDEQPEVGTIPLLTYAMPRGGTGSFVEGRLPLGVTGELVDDGNGTLSLEITAVNFPVWTGATDGVWDQSTLNWKDRETSEAIAYVDPLPVLFDDTAVTTDITLNSTVAPGALRFETFEKEYSITGAGRITGPTGLIKDGSTNLTIGTENDFTGPVAINGGTVIVNSVSPAGSAGSLGAGSSPIVFFGGGLNHTGAESTTDRGVAVNSPGTIIATTSGLTFGGPVTSNGGSLVKEGAGKLAFTHDGEITLGTVANGCLVHDGTLELRGNGSQTVTVAGEMWVADQPDRPANLLLQDTTLTMPSWLAIGRGNGDGGTTNLTVTGSTLNTTNFSTGFNNGLANNQSEATVVLNDSVWNNNGLTYLAESTGSQATFTLNGASRYNISSNFLVARFAGTNASVTLNGTSSITKTGGYTSIGTEGTGRLTLNGSSSFTSTTGDFNIGDVGASVGTLELLGAGSINVTNVYIGKNSSTSGTYRQTGGAFQSGSFIYFGSGSGSTGSADISGGTVTAATVIHVAGAGSATVGISGNAVVTANGDGVLIGGANGGTGTLNFSGGTIVAKRLFEAAGASSTVNFNGGTLRAGAGANATFLGPIDTAVIQAGGVTIDTSGQNLSATANLSGAGGLTKSGAGTLTLSGTNTYTGNTTVSAGTLSLSAPFLGNTSAVTIAAGATLTLSHGQVDTVGSLVVAGSPLPAGTYGAVQLPGVITGTGSLLVQGSSASAYDTWIGGYPSIPLADRDPGDDPDRDGFTNAMEFALGGAPNSGSSRPRIHTIIADSSGDTDAQKELLMTIAVRTGTPAFGGSPSPTAARDGYTYKIEGSMTLGGFTTAIVKPVNVVAPIVPAPAGYEYRTFSLSDSNGTPSRGFLRVDITP